MGNRHTLNPQIPIINLQEWEEASVNSSDQAIYGDFRSLHRINHEHQQQYNDLSEIVDQYELFFSDEEDYKLYLQAFIWRLKQPNIVRTRYLKQQHSQQFCSKTYSVKVYIENIKTRLSDITDIPFPENLYVAFCAFEGYHKLYDHLHYFKVEQSQICVDAQGQVRIWLNSDLSKNYPNMQQEQLTSDETHMVQQILTILDQNTDKDSEPASLVEFYQNFYQRNSYKNKGRIGFEDAKLILEQYVRQHNVHVPTCFESIMQIYRNEQGIDQGQQQFDGNNIQLHNDISHENNKLKHSRTSHQGYSRSIHLNGVNQATSFPLNSNHQHYQPVSSYYTNSGAMQSHPQEHRLRIPQTMNQNGRIQSHSSEYVYSLNINSKNKPNSVNSNRHNQSNASPSFAPSLRQRQNYQASANPHVQQYQPFQQITANYYHTSQHLFTIPLPQRHNISLQPRHPTYANSVPKPMSALPSNYRAYSPNAVPVHTNHHMPFAPVQNQHRRNFAVLQNQQRFSEERVRLSQQRIPLSHQIHQKAFNNSLTNLQNQEMSLQERERMQQNNQSFNPPSSHKSKGNNIVKEGNYSIIRENPAQLLNSSSPSLQKTEGYMDVSSGRKIVSAVSPSQSQLQSKGQMQAVSSNSYHSNSYANQQTNQIQRMNSGQMRVFHGNNGAIKKSSLGEYQQQLYNETGFKISNSSVLRNSVPSGASGSQHNHSRHIVRQKTQYYTLESIQNLDPQIAQDLKKFYSFE